jgi:CMP-N,N'-diacetyllegionaminic acid synthase
MDFNSVSVLAVVPARGGSKSIPRKNLCTINGESLVARAANIIKSLPWIKHGVLSTDDKEIAEEGMKHGLDVPFMRPEYLSGDTASSIDMWKHAWIESEKYYQTRFDISVLLEPTSPLRIQEDIERAVSKLINDRFTSAATVSPTPAHYTPQKTLVVKNDVISFYHTQGSLHSLRQSIPRYFHRNGLCYAVTRDHLLERSRIIDDTTAAVVVERVVVNIDEPFELKLAEWLINESNQS